MLIQLDTTCRDERGHVGHIYPADYDDDEEEALLGYECGVRDEDGLLNDEDYDVDPEEISQEECDALAAGAQRFGWKAGRK
eukprot:6489455-Pyramimonas_sp.AAC.1